MALTRRLALASALACMTWSAWAGNGPGGYPDKTVRLIVPFPAGGATDLMARSMAQKLAERIGQAVVIDNRAGAGGGIGAEAVASAAKDGYTLLYSTMGVLTLNPSLYRNLRYDPVTSFTPVGMTHVTSNLLVVNRQLPAQSVEELVALARKSPGALTFSSAGNGTSSHLSGELFKSLAGIDIQHVPYKGTSAAMPDLLAGRISMTFDTASNFVDYIKNGQVRPLGVTSHSRSPAMPDLPAISESAGFKAYDVSLWLGVLAPAGTPSAITHWLQQQLAQVMSAPAMADYLKPYGIQPLHGNGTEFAATIARDRQKWAAVIKAAGIQAQ